MFCSDSANALNWVDKEWINGGCPKTAFGTWVADNKNINKGNTLVIAKGEIVIADRDGREEKFLTSKDMLAKKNRYIEIPLHSSENKNEVNAFFKIRPHLVSSQAVLQSGIKKSYNCYIKVFKFFPSGGIRFNKFSSWEIYQL